MIKLEQLAVDFAEYNSSYLLGSRVFLLIKQNWHLCMVDSEIFLNKENLWGRAEILNHLEFSQHNFINTSTFFMTQSTKGKITHCTHICEFSKDTLLSKRHSVVVEENKLEFVSNDWIIVYH